MLPRSTVRAAALPSTADSGWVSVGEGHQIHYESRGARDGIPIVLLHGGPGSRSSARQRGFLDATRYRIVQFDQRGCGRSTPLGGTDHNETDALVGDIETLRRHLGIRRWAVAGGSWGAALALLYASRHREQASGLLLRGTFLADAADIDWFFHGVAASAPQAHRDFMAVVPHAWRRNPAGWLDRCLATAGAGSDAQAVTAANAWHAYECRLDRGAAPPAAAPGTDAARRLVAKYRIQAHYLAHRCFLAPGAVLHAAASLAGVPVAIIHGTRDLVCRPANATRLQRTCTGSRLAWVQGTGHDPFHPSAQGLLRHAAASFAATGDFSHWETT